MEFLYLFVEFLELAVVAIVVVALIAAVLFALLEYEPGTSAPRAIAASTEPVTAALGGGAPAAAHPPAGGLAPPLQVLVARIVSTGLAVPAALLVAVLVDPPEDDASQLMKLPGDDA